MKKRIFSLLAFTAMLLMPGKTWAEITMTFSYVNTNNEVIKDAMSSYNTPVYVYSEGESIAATEGITDDSWNFTGSWKMTFDDAFAGKKVSYETNFGQRGTFTITDGGTLTSTLVTLTVTVKDTEGQPVEDACVYIYKPNGNSSNYYTNEEGQIIKYYTASEGYRWAYGEQEGNFDLTADYALNITKQAVTTFNLRVKARYGDYPLGNRSFYLFKYGETNKYVTELYGGYSAKVDAGDYWVKDDMGVFSEKFTVSADMTYWVNYNMVTFTSMTGTTPNANQDVRVYHDYTSDSYGYSTVRTNEKGEATVYLQAGNYTYRHLGTMADFTVGKADQTVAIKTSSLTITLDCSATAEELEEQEFRWAKSDADRYDYTNVRPDGKTITIAPVMPGDYKLTINGTNTVDVTVAEGENNKTVKLFALQFTTNILTTSSIYVNDRNLRMAFNMKYFLTAGDYSYGLNYYGDGIGTVNLTKDTDVALNYGILTVTVKDSKGVVEGQYVTFGGRGGNTDENGQVTFTKLLAEGDFILSARDCYIEQEIDLKAGEQATTLIIPDVVTFNALHMGEIFTGNLLIYSTEDRHTNYNVTVKDGVATSRLNPALTYTVDGYQGSTTITEGSTLSLGQINVTCDGMGIALPMENWEAVSSYPVLVGATVRLAAIPVSGVNFQKWDINGTEYTEGMIDLTIKAAVTNAKAVFGGTIPSKVNSRQINTSFSNDEQYVYLPDDVNGTVNIYSMEGKQMKNIGVSGNRIGIYDLPAGAYILTLECVDGDIQVARFMK